MAMQAGRPSRLLGRLSRVVASCLFAAAAALDEESCPVASGSSQVQVLSSAPRIYLLDGFLDDAEVQHLRAVAEELGIFYEAPHDPEDSQDSTGYHQEYVDEVLSDSDPILKGLEEKIATLSHIPRDPGAAATISVACRNASASPPGLTNLHHDHNAAAMALLPFVKQGRLVPVTELRATLLGYFADVEKGGETIFPCVCNRTLDACRKTQSACKFLYESGVMNVHANGFNTPFRKEAEGMREKIKKAANHLVGRSTALCNGQWKDGLKISPRAGRAILFYSNGVRGFADPRAWHGSCRVVKGQKLAMQRFLYAPQAEEETGKHAMASFKWK